MLEMQTNTKLPTIGTLLASWVIKLAILPITLSLKERVRMMPHDHVNLLTSLLLINEFLSDILNCF